MKTKLTLSVDKELLQFARQQAQKNSVSISGMFSDFILIRKAQSETPAIPSVTHMVGSLKQYTIDDSKTALHAAYAQKYTD